MISSNLAKNLDILLKMVELDDKQQFVKCEGDEPVFICRYCRHSEKKPHLFDCANCPFQMEDEEREELKNLINQTKLMELIDD